MSWRGRALAWAGAGLLAACAAPAPSPAPTAPDVPAAWKLESPWRAGVPRDAVPKGEWWKVFGDVQLDQLQARSQAASPTLALAAARLAQARALWAASSAAQSPSLGLGLRAARQRISANRPLSNYNSPNFGTVQNDFTAALGVSYEVDLSGRVQRALAGAQAAAEQSAAELENTRLLLAADLATAYFSLRSLDYEAAVLTRSIELQKRALGFVTTRHDLGAASGLDVAQQQALLDTTLTQIDVLRRQRALFEHALATLVGTAAPQFDLPGATGPGALPAVPEVPPGLPSEMLERRPDVAAAERAMAVANAQVGVARAAFYPSITLAPTFGVESRALSSLFDTPSLVWSLGAQVSQVLFDGGRLKANLAYAQAGHEAAAASYRRVVLTAMQEAEDGITGVATLGRATTQAETAVQSARRVLELANGRYEGGVSTYLDVITAQQALLTSERQATQLRGQAVLACVFLVKALGGGW